MPASVLFLVPAREGSKRLPGKNMAEVGGYTLTEIALMQATEASARFIDSVVALSTDSDAIAEQCAWTGCDIIKRPAELATDDASSAEVALHAAALRPCILLCLVQPTSPLREVQDIVDCLLVALEHSIPCWSIRDDSPDPSGAVYVTAPELLARTGSFIGRPGQGIRVSGSDVDIDTAADLQYARELWALKS